jgi:GntR family transcriptional regulator/MocR family aminotransferase
MNQDRKWTVTFGLDRTATTSLVEQLRRRLADAIADGTLAPGSRLPSWRDLASQLGIARGTVRQAYAALVDADLIVTAGAKGTRVTSQPASRRATTPVHVRTEAGFPFFAVAPLPLQVSVPSQAGFPIALWTRLSRQATQQTMQHSVGYPDPCGEAELRQEIAKHLALARGLLCEPAQILVTSGYGAGLGLVLRVLELAGKTGWMEEPGYPVAREAMRSAGIKPVSIPVDADGMDVESAIAIAPDASVAIVTPGQQAPLGVSLSRSRRQALLSWATRTGAWIIEDDYLGELQIAGRATRALAGLEGRSMPSGARAQIADRIIYLGTFSKTVSPMLRLGFVVVPIELVSRMTRAVALGMPAPGPTMQQSLAWFMRDGHYLRHLRRMKSLYRRNAAALRACAANADVADTQAGLALLLRLPPGTDDRAICAQARLVGLAPTALSGWYADAALAVPGLLLGVTNVDPASAARTWRGIQRLLR